MPELATESLPGLPEGVVAPAGIDPHELVDWREEYIGDAPGGLDVSDAEMELAHYLKVQNAIEADMDRLTENYRRCMTALARKRDGYVFLYAARAEAACRELLKGGKKKSVRTLFGTAGFRATKELLVVEDDVAVLEAAQAGELPAELVKTTTTTRIDKEALNALYAATGEIPVGCTLRPAGEAFYIKD